MRYEEVLALKLRLEGRLNKPVCADEQIATTRMTFFAMEHHPKALRFERHLDGRLIREGVVPLRNVSVMRAEGRNLVEAYSTSGGQVSLPLNAVYWPVKKEQLEIAEDSSNDLYDVFDNVPDDPGHVMIYKSDWDHTIWDIEGEPILMPIALTLWGTRFDLQTTETYLKAHPAVVSFEIVRNDCSQNFDISGRYLGKLVLDLRKLDPEKIKPTRSWVEEHVINGWHGDEHDLLGLAPFRRSGQ